MVDSTASPRAGRLATPSWLDTRLVLGVLLVLLSVVLGARLLAAADQSTQVWSSTRALAPGTELGEDDLELTAVRLLDRADAYLAGDKPVGYVLQRSVGEGELLPRAALSRPGEDTDYRAVTVPVPSGHLAPDLDVGEQVDVWVTPEQADRQQAAGLPRRVLAAVAVLARPGEDGLTGDAGEAVVLRVETGDVAALLAAVAEGTIDLVRVPRASEVDVELVPAG